MTWFRDLLYRFTPRVREARAIDALLAEKIARVRAEAAERRAAFLVEASQVLFSSLEYEATLSSVARMAVPYLADWCAVDLVQGDGAIHRVAVAHADPTKLQVALDLSRRYPVDPQAPYGSAKVLRSGSAEVYREITDEMLAAVAQDEAHLETLRQAGLTSGMCVPLAAQGRTLGTISFGSTRVTRAYGADDLALAEELALRAAQAVDNARRYDELRRDRKRSEEAASLRSVSALAAAAAHEINNPLCVVVAQAGLLAREAGVPRGRIDAIRDAAERIAQVVTDMSQIVSLKQVPSHPHLPDMLDLRGSTDPARADR